MTAPKNPAVGRRAKSNGLTLLFAVGGGAAVANLCWAQPLWSLGGWTAIALSGVAASLFALAVWAVGRRGPLVTATAA